MSDEELRQRIKVIKEKLIKSSSTVLSMCDLEGNSLRHPNYYDNSSRIYLLIARLFKMTAALKSYEYFDIQGIVNLFWTISIKGENKKIIN